MGSQMKSVMEDFADIAARLNQIEQEKLAVSAPVDDSDGSAEKTPNGIAWDSVYGFTPGVEDVYCVWSNNPSYQEYLNYRVWREAL